ncbi:MAG: carboxypeptidase-like regulatory domain-containing protein, partial [Acidobacteriota bacterium]|nr:carboxypeptidase-like regulatory domain-containing protein [Acidobacteriota bacterium]
MLVLFGLFGLSAAAVVAKDDADGRIAGSVADILGEPLRGALIQVVQTVEDGESFTTLRSDARGFFKTAILAPGVYRLQVAHQGYRSVSTTRFVVDGSRSVSLEIALQKFIGAISGDEDPRNQGLRQVLRGGSDRRLIFRSVPGSDTVPAASTATAASANDFTRGGAMRIASGSAQSEGYLLRPQASQNGVSSNFAFTEPLSSHSRVILSGQVDTGAGSFWRLRNTYNYRPDKDRDYSISVGYGRMAGNQLVSDSISSGSSGRLLPSVDGLETFAFSTEGATRLFDLLSVRYGVDYTRLHYGEDKSYFYPSVQILLTPSEGWGFETSLTSRRLSDASSIMLPGGEVLNLAEPTLIAMVGDHVSMSQVRHAETVVRRELNPNTSLEFAVYRDRIDGAGIPLLVTATTSLGQHSGVIEINDGRHFGQKGLRLTAKHSIFEHLTGSVVYIYGESREISL